MSGNKLVTNGEALVRSNLKNYQEICNNLTHKKYFYKNLKVFF